VDEAFQVLRQRADLLENVLTEGGHFPYYNPKPPPKRSGALRPDRWQLGQPRFERVAAPAKEYLAFAE
jgi:hypothetical protein